MKRSPLWMTLALATACGGAKAPPESELGVVAGDTVVASDSLDAVANASTNGLAFSNYSRALLKPRFEDYPAPPGPSTIHHPPVLDRSPSVRQYRTVIGEAAANGPNFAGHFTLASWGCGSPCTGVAIIDDSSGTVHMIDHWFGRPPLFRKDSRLLVHDPTTAASDSLGHPLFGPVQYFIWDGTQLQLIDSIVDGHVRFSLR